MDSRESLRPPQPPHHHQAPPLHSQSLMMSQSHPLSHHPNNSSYNNNNHSINPNSSITATMIQQQHQQLQHQQNARFNFNSDTLNSPHGGRGDGSSPAGFRDGGFNIDSAKKKRGRPRKFSPSPDGNNIALGLTPATIAPISSAGGHVDSNDGVRSSPMSENSGKKARGRPASSGKKQLDALGSFGIGFTPHVIMVDMGEDIASKIMAFSQQGPRTICILSANGAISNVTLRQPSISGGTVTYEGRFEIISLSGSLFSESDNNCSRTGGLIVSLAGPDGRILGGEISGVLKAATPVQVIVGSFIADGKKQKYGSTSTATTNMLTFGAPVPESSPPSDGGSSESSDESGSSPNNNRTTSYNIATQQPIQNIPMYATTNMGWPNSTINTLPNRGYSQ